MEARNAAGRRVSLLNDDSVGHEKSGLHHQPHHETHRQPHRQTQHESQKQRQQQQLTLGFPFATGHILSRQYHSLRSSSPSPNTPELVRSDPYDSQNSNDPISPLTPSIDYHYPRGDLYGSELPPKRPAYVDSSRATSYDDDSSAPAAAAPAAERPAKRYPCRYRDSHGCGKTFTTSGHASRHSKIHTAEKAVQCSYPGCQKKFTRADNMKQHLETHFKDKSRSSASQRAQKAALAEARRISSTNARSRSSTCTTATSSGGSKPDVMQWESDTCTASSQAPPPTTTSGSWEMRTSNLAMSSRPAAVTSPGSGLDALAMAIACQEGAARS